MRLPLETCQRGVWGGGIMIARKQNCGDGRERGKSIYRLLKRVPSNSIVVEHVARHNDYIYLAFVRELSDSPHGFKALRSKLCRAFWRDKGQFYAELPVSGMQYPHRLSS